MQKQRLNQLLRIVGTISAFAMLIFLLSRQGWDEILAGVRSIPPWRFAVAIVLMFASRTAIAARWHTLMRSAGIPVSVRESLRITFAGLFASNFLPTTIGGDVVRLAMALRMGYDKVIATASIAVDRLVGMAGMASAAPFGLIPLAGAVPVSSISSSASMSLLAGFRTRAASIFRKVFDALRIWLRSPRGLLMAFAWTWLHQLCLFSVVWLMLHGLGETIPYWLVGGLWSFTYFITLVPISINGLGLQELSMTAVFTSIGGVDVGSAATAALLVRTIQMLASLPGAGTLPDILSGGRMLDQEELKHAG